MRRVLQVGLLFIALNSTNSWADQNNPELDQLFELLQSTTNSVEAAAINQKIWQNWYQSDNKEIEELMNKGEVSMRVGLLKQAVEFYSRIIEIDPGFAEGWNRRATVYYMMGEYQLSTQDVVETLRLEPRHYGALSGQGMIYTQLKEAELALEFYQRALEVNPHMAGVERSIKAIKKQLQKQVI